MRARTLVSLRETLAERMINEREAAREYGNSYELVYREVRTSEWVIVKRMF